MHSDILMLWQRTGCTENKTGRNHFLPITITYKSHTTD